MRISARKECGFLKTGNDATDKVMRKTLLKYLFLLFLQVLSPVALHSQFRPGAFDNLTDSETVRALKGHVGTIASTMMEGRAAGSEGERLAAEYVTGVFRSYGIDVLSGEDGDLFGIRQEGGDTLRSRNVCAFIEGTDKSLSDRYIVIGARMDNLGTGTLTVDGETVERIRYGANGNASGLAMLLEVGRLLKTNNMMLRRSVLLVAFGASRKGMVGSWYFLNRSFSDVANIDAMINLDMLGTGPESLTLRVSLQQPCCRQSRASLDSCAGRGVPNRHIPHSQALSARRSWSGPLSGGPVAELRIRQETQGKQHSR